MNAESRPCTSWPWSHHGCNVAAAGCMGCIAHRLGCHPDPPMLCRRVGAQNAIPPRPRGQASEAQNSGAQGCKGARDEAQASRSAHPHCRGTDLIWRLQSLVEAQRRCGACSTCSTCRRGRTDEPASRRAVWARALGFWGHTDRDWVVMLNQRRAKAAEAARWRLARLGRYDASKVGSP